jgi:two-component SAPR family response regulator
MSKILIVEDEIIIADSIKRYLTKMGHEIIGIAISYKQALDILGNIKPDIVLLDIHLNGRKTGIDLANYIKTNLHIPYIYLSAQVSSDIFHAAKLSRPSGFISKPIQKENLYTTIEIALYNYINKADKETLLA